MLCAVIGAKLQGASRIIALSHHEDLAKLAREFGATDVVSEKGDDAVKKVLELTNGVGADAVLECVGATSSINEAGQIARPGAIIGRLGYHKPNRLLTNCSGKTLAYAVGLLR